MYSVHWVVPIKNIDEKHGEFNTLEEAQASVHAFWQSKNFKPLYIRETLLDTNGASIKWDYGSHVAFYEFIFHSTTN
ncbi:hypothetical protein DES38_10697 [Streptohalobacillus salinus]|uniref:Uncharacterized protein n=2 Tax=Streptohalobacillus salinus TaxID=621096 RepID=A0A2V3WD77_9BACI|nr:hypothetical protein DES38_10697 [Streptohalobacillus salinus]